MTSELPGFRAFTRGVAAWVPLDAVEVRRGAFKTGETLTASDEA